MTRSKLKMDLRQQVLEVEGTDAFVARMVDRFEALVASGAPSGPTPSPERTRLIGVNWAHGAQYDPAAALQLLTAVGLRFVFSGPVMTASIGRGLVEVRVVEGGAGRASGVVVVGSQADAARGPTAPDLTVRSTTREALNDGDQVVIAVRGGSLVDPAGRLVDWALFGTEAEELPGGPAPRTRPTPRPGSVEPMPAAVAGTFESWFWIAG